MNKNKKNIKDILPGETFKDVFGTEYKMVRHYGEIEAPTMNQWGRLEGGTKTQIKCAVKKNLGPRKGGWVFKYVAFNPKDTFVVGE